MTADEHQVRHPVFSRLYARLSQHMEPELGQHRHKLLAGLSGDVIEVGAGNGMNFAHYPPTVESVLAVEPEPHLRRLAQAAAARAPVRIDVVDGVAERLPVEDARFDAAVLSLVLCSVRDPVTALREVVRVLRRGGQLRFLEHVQADTALLRGAQRLLDATVWPYLAGGCHVHRDALAAIETAGLTVLDVEAIRFPDTRLSTPTSRHVLGIASRR